MPKPAGVNHLNAVRALGKVVFHIARRGKHIVMTGCECLDRGRKTRKLRMRGIHAPSSNNRPGIYAGLTEHSHLVRGGEANQPGMNAGPITAFGANNRERP